MVGTPRFRTSLSALIVSSSLSLTGCQSAFLTSAANAIGTSLPALALTSEQEQALGEQAYQDLIRGQKRTTHPEYQAVVEKVGHRIAEASGRPDFNWEFTVLAGSTRNAFCLPGGKVVVYEGLLPVCENEAGLAVVMSHEIAHAIARHGGQRMREQAVIDAVGLALEQSAGSEDEQRLLLLQAAYGAGTNLGISLPFSRMQETEADSIGLTLMSKAGYNPEEAPRFWRRFQGTNKATMPELLSSHPSDQRRAAHLETLLPQAERYYAAAAAKHDRGEQIANLLPATPANVTTQQASSLASRPRTTRSTSSGALTGFAAENPPTPSATPSVTPSATEPSITQGATATATPLTQAAANKPAPVANPSENSQAETTPQPNPQGAARPFPQPEAKLATSEPAVPVSPAQTAGSSIQPAGGTVTPEVSPLKPAPIERAAWIGSSIGTGAALKATQTTPAMETTPAFSQPQQTTGSTTGEFIPTPTAGPVSDDPFLAPEATNSSSLSEAGWAPTPR